MPVLWLPRKQNQRLVWFQNFASKLGGYVGVAGVTPADVASTLADLAAYQWLVLTSSALRTDLKSLNSYKRLLTLGKRASTGGTYPAAPVLPPPPAVQVLPGIFARLGMLVERMKNTDGYNAAMGENLGIEPPERSDDFGTPRLKVEALADGTVRLKYFKGRANGVVIERQRGDETGWAEIARDLFPPFIDRDPPLEPGRPEVRRYRIRYLKRDEPVGDRSAEVSVTTMV
jgi:hypothetical protein